MSRPPRGWTTELLGLLLRYPHHRRLHHRLGLSPEEAATYLYSKLVMSGGRLWALQKGQALGGLLHFREVSELTQGAWSRLLLLDEVFLDRQTTDRQAQVLLRFAVGDALRAGRRIRAHLPSKDFRLSRVLKEMGFGVAGGRAVMVADDLQLDLPELLDMHIHPYRALAPEDLTGFAKVLDCEVPNPSRTASRVAVPPDASGRWTLVARRPGSAICGVITARRDPAGREVELDHLAELEFVWMADQVAGDELADFLIRHALVRLHREGVRAVRLNQALVDLTGGCSLPVLEKTGFRVAERQLVLQSPASTIKPSVSEPFCSEVSPFSAGQKPIIN
jgi:hypothetical protein